MAAADLELLDRFITDLPDRPRGFAERGATVPFTTPALAAARLRRLGTAPAEVLVPAPNGRGTCVLDWSSCLALSPSLHDRDLWTRLEALPRVTPAGIRAAARASAATGLGGRAAQAAARIASAAARAAPAAEAAQADPLAAQEARLDGLALLAEAANAAALDAELAADREAARLVASAARLSLAGARATLTALRQAMAAPPDADAQAEAQRAALAERPDWLLDGWALPVALLAEGGKAALDCREMLTGLAAPALEAERWWPSAGGWEAVLQGRARLAPRPGWAVAPRSRMAPRLEAALAGAA